jgi:phosphatidylserine/phosphatidylglycerophosphate/cardiolipin synthase-like enzyme
MLRKILLVLLFLTVNTAHAQLGGKLKIYFTSPVNTSVSTGVNAIYLNNCMSDTLVAYINRAKYTLDIAVYNYQQSTSNMANIAQAVNNATTRGVIVRWIYDGAQSNSGLTALNSNVHTLASPTGSAYGIMHNKFMIVDALSSNVNDALVWTGSTNWTKTHFNSNSNNTIIVQDKNLAQAFLTEFNEMWGSAGNVPNTSVSKFGPYKTNNTAHTFTIGGAAVELYFSPSDSCNAQVVSAINTADTDAYFGMLSFSLTSNSAAIINKKNAGVYVAGIIDQSSQLYTPYNSLTTALGTNFKVYSQLLSVYHNKLLLIDASNPTSNPTTLTGSYNWTTPAATQNDENLLIIHDATVANIFYQSFHQSFTNLGGTLNVVTSTQSSAANASYVTVALANNSLHITTAAAGLLQNITITNLMGQILLNNNYDIGVSNSVVLENIPLNNGVYFITIKTNTGSYIKKMHVTNY